MTDLSNWIELGLTEAERKLVDEAAASYQATYVKTLDTVFKEAEAIGLLQKKHYGTGERGSYADILVQFGFTARDGESPMDKSIRSNYKELLEHKAAVQKWWQNTEEKKKKHWISVRAIYNNWKKSAKPAPTQNSNRPPRLSPTEKLQKDKADLVKHNIELKQQMEKLQTGSSFEFFDVKKDKPAEIATAIIANASAARAKSIAENILAQLKAPPAPKGGKGKSDKGRSNKTSKQTSNDVDPQESADARRAENAAAAENDRQANAKTSKAKTGTALTVAPSGVIDPETGRLSMPERLEPKQSATKVVTVPKETPLLPDETIRWSLRRSDWMAGFDVAWWHGRSLKGDYLIEPKEQDDSVVFELVFKSVEGGGSQTLEEICIEDFDEPVAELKKRAEEYLKDMETENVE